MHDVKADAAQRGVLKSLGNGPDDVKSERLPKSHGDVVRFHNGVELHRGVSLLTSPGERVLAERTSDPRPPCEKASPYRLLCSRGQVARREWYRAPHYYWRG